MREGVGGRVSEESSLRLPPELSPVQRSFRVTRVPDQDQRILIELGIIGSAAIRTVRCAMLRAASPTQRPQLQHIGNHVRPPHAQASPWAWLLTSNAAAAAALSTWAR